VPNGIGSIDEVYGAMTLLEQPVFEDIFEQFISFDYAPSISELSALGDPFPFSYRYPPEWQSDDRAMGRDADKMFQFTVEVVFIAGPASNDFGELTREVTNFILPFYTLYYANRSIMGEVRNIDLSRKGVTGDVILNGYKFYGASFPVVCHQRRHFVSQL
jgi:hypothetical protein